MKYFGFLARYVIVPLFILRLLHSLDRQRGKQLPEPLTSWNEENALAVHALVALTYTTIWDNYLVASKVWSYNPRLVNGLTIGWVPIEEYTFFVLQPLLTGSWLQYLARRLPSNDVPYSGDKRTQLLLASGLGVAWIMTLTSLLRGNPRTKYLNLIISWALPPIMFQIGFGGDILWRNRNLIAASIIPATAYLSFADSQAIHAGTWTINPHHTIGVEVMPDLPLEEFLFFLLTNTLLVFGVTLVQSKESESRLPMRFQKRYFAFKRQLTGEN